MSTNLMGLAAGGNYSGIPHPLHCLRNFLVTPIGGRWSFCCCSNSTRRGGFEPLRILPENK